MFTDGSVLDGKNVGCGIYISIPNEGTYEVSYRLNDYMSIFQAELTALKMAAELLLQEERIGETINLYSDSLSSIQALNSLIIKSDSVKVCLETINRLGLTNIVKLSWVKAHLGICGNERANTLAKQGAKSEAGSIIELLPPSCIQRAAIREFYYEKWTKEYRLTNKARQTKLFFPLPNQKKSFEVVNRSRQDLSMLVRCCTGHNFLRKHRFVQKRVADSKCHMCEFEEESSLHLIMYCPAFELLRITTFNNEELDITRISKLDLDKLLHFIKVTKIGNMISKPEN